MVRKWNTLYIFDMLSATCVLISDSVIFGLIVVGTRAGGIVKAIKGLTGNTEKTELTKRQIDFYSESLVLKRQKNTRSEIEHIISIKSSQPREKRSRRATDGTAEKLERDALPAEICAGERRM